MRKGNKSGECGGFTERLKGLMTDKVGGVLKKWWDVEKMKKRESGVMIKRDL